MGDLDSETWRWIWLGVVVLFAVGELATGALFLLPFAIGAVPAFILSWVAAPVWLQWLVFVVVSFGSLFWLRRFAHERDNASQSRVGASRLIGQSAIVTQAIDPSTGAGEVRVESELWRAVPTDGLAIDVGTTVTVHEITGSRLAVAPEIASAAPTDSESSPGEGTQS